MLRISMEPWKMDCYLSSVIDNTTSSNGSRYKVEMRGYIPWTKIVMTISRSNQIRSIYHPESGEN